MRGQQEETVMGPDSSEEKGGSHDADVQRQRDWMCRGRGTGWSRDFSHKT